MFKKTKESQNRMKAILKSPLRFVLRVVSGFRANQGFLLAGAVAYYTLLSIVPIFALMLVTLSHVISQKELLEATRSYLELVGPGQSQVLLAQIEDFLNHWELAGGIVVLSLLFFSSLAFTVLENAMSVIFFHRVAVRRRRFLVSAILPYFYILLLGIGLLVVTIVSTGLHALSEDTITLFGHTVSLSGATTAVVYLLGVLGEILLLTSLYMVMPVGRLALRHALSGGATAAVLWEITRHILVWYFSTLSFVNVIYGSFAATIIILLSVEIGAIIVLLGAQVIAEYERTGTEDEGRHGLST
jgi:membrane protein